MSKDVSFIFQAFTRLRDFSSYGTMTHTYQYFSDSSEHKPAGSGSGFDPFSLGPSSVGPVDRFSPFGSVQSNGVLDRNGTETNSRPHSNHSSNSGGQQTGSISGLGGLPNTFGGNSLLSQLENNKRPSPPGISTNQIPSGPPGLGGVSANQIGSGPQKLDLGNPLSTRFVPSQ